MGEPHPDWELGRRGVMRCSYRMPSLECGIVADVLSGDQLYISANHISKERDGNAVEVDFLLRFSLHRIKRRLDKRMRREGAS